MDGEKVCSCYTFENGTTPSHPSPGDSWPRANKSCKYNNKHLVVLETEREWDFINKEIQNRKTYKAASDEWFIGLYRNLATGNWTWINGKPLTIDKWQQDKPADRDFYSLIAKDWPLGHKGSFNSIKGNIHKEWICEEETVNCQGICLSHNLLPTISTPPVTTTSTAPRETSTAYDHTNVSDNCQGVCSFHNLVPTNSTPPRTTITTSTTEMKTSTAYHHTNISADSTTTTSVTGVSGQKGDDEKCSTIVIITTATDPKKHMVTRNENGYLDFENSRNRANKDS
ncbi:Asialoglycoprotein receptor 1 [Desmophyllum pertusum]|uniref:Asialoglycoprotein receptor 1 n=1 Tax=Desmophyllum pertusum TaxID=174260 RepID=A0A9X0CUK9_9CNID|nr:Asialoglycoprotein receptor 1 [Desmophyllum pertusum]